jgi:hypothetical protein
MGGFDFQMGNFFKIAAAFAIAALLLGCVQQSEFASKSSKADANRAAPTPFQEQELTCEETGACASGLPPALPEESAVPASDPQTAQPEMPPALPD